MTKLTNHFQRTRLITSLTDKYCSLDSEEDFLSGCQNVSHQHQFWHDSIPAKTRRVLMTKWAGAAWRELHSDSHFVKKRFEKTGCLKTANGDDDEKIRPQGLEPYTF